MDKKTLVNQYIKPHCTIYKCTRWTNEHNIVLDSDELIKEVFSQEKKRLIKEYALVFYIGLLRDEEMSIKAQGKAKCQ